MVIAQGCVQPALAPNIDAAMARVLGMEIFRDRAAAARWARAELDGTAVPRGLVVEDAGNLALELRAR